VLSVDVDVDARTLVHVCMTAEQQEWMIAITLNIAFINRVDDKVSHTRLPLWTSSLY
jgi:hypothetical protein